MRYFSANNQIFGYDETVESQLPYIDAAIERGDTEITGSWPPPPSSDEHLAIALAAINHAAQQAGDAVSASYPQFEIDSWQDQEREARAWLLDSNALTPTLSGIASARGLTMVDLCQRVIVKADAFRPYIAAIIGQRQALEDALDAAITPAEIEAIITQARNPSTWML